MTTATLSPAGTKVKFRLAGGAQPLILVPVQVNDSGPFDFILDTGAGMSLLTSELAAQLGVKILDVKEGQTAGGKVSVSLAKVESLAVGEAKLDNVDVAVVDLGHLGKTVGATIEGDIGYNFLKHFRITIDYRTTEIRFEDPNRIDSFGHTAKTEVPIRLANPAKPLILVDVYANGRGSYQFAIDTGTSTTAITPEAARQLGVETSLIGPITTGSARVAASAGNVKSFQVGGARIDSMPVIVAGFFDALSSVVGAKLDGI